MSRHRGHPAPGNPLSADRTLQRPRLETIPSWCVLGTRDKIIAPSLQLKMAQRAHSKITRFAAGHLSLITAPGVVTSVIWPPPARRADETCPTSEACSKVNYPEGRSS